MSDTPKAGPNAGEAAPKRGRGRPRKPVTHMPGEPSGEAKPKRIVGKACAWGEKPAMAPIAESTVEQYRRFAVRMIRAAARDLGLDTDQVSLADAAEWLVRSRVNYKPGSFRIYRSALIWQMEDDGRPESEITQLRDTDDKDCRTTSIGGNITKRRWITDEDLLQLIQRLTSRGLISDNREVAGGLSSRLMALEWLLAGISVGLRPSEWANARIEILDGVETLVVKNEKVQNTAAGDPWRGNGEYRKIDISGLPGDDLKRVRRLVGMFQGVVKEGRFEHVYRLCREVLRRANEAIWPQRRTHITLYSGRHQCSADLKASGLPPEEVAALMGHVSVATSTRHYGKTKQGTAGRGRLKADPTAVARVRIQVRKDAAADTGLTGGKGEGSKG